MALENMSAAFAGLPMGDLIGGPLNASCEAQVRLAMATADFIRVVGFNEPDDKNKPYEKGVRTALFQFKRPVLLPAKPDAGSGSSGGTAVVAGPPVIKTETVEIEVPVLSIVKIPSLSITSVDVTFDMEVKSSESSKASTDASASMEAGASFGWGPVKGNVTIKGSVATHKENTRSSDNSARYHVEVHAKDGGMPEGLARVLDILAQAVAPKSISAPA